MGSRYRRRGWIGSIALLALAALIFSRAAPPGEPAGPAGPSSATARVSRVIDGDTIEVRISGRLDEVRYIGVDTPETVKPGTPVQCFGPRASHFNHSLLTGRRVRLVFDRERRDVYERLLAYVHLGRRFVNAELVRRGLARTLTIAPNDRRAPLFARLELRAAREGAGLWGRC